MSSSMKCERCGASVPLLVASHARCLYCAHDNAVPEDLRGALLHHQGLEAKVEQALTAGMQTADTAARYGTLMAAFVIGSLLLGVVPSCIWLLFMVFTLEDPTILVSLCIMCGSAVPFVVAPIGWVVLVRNKTRRRFAQVPLAVPRVDDAGLGADCPKCGAGLPLAVDVTSRCGHCGTESLLPVPMLNPRYIRLHQKAMKARSAAAEGMQDAVSTWQRYFVPAIIGFNVVLMLLIGAGIIGYKLFVE